jgi:hypothetical protein
LGSLAGNSISITFLHDSEVEKIIKQVIILRK